MPQLPAGGGALKARGVPKSQLLRTRVPKDLLHADSSGLNPQAVEGICRAAPTRRGGRSRLHDERGVTGEPIAVGRQRGVGNVQVAGQQQVHAALGHGGHRRLRATHQLTAIRVAGRQIKWMMGDDHFRDFAFDPTETVTQPGDLRRIKPTILGRQRTGGIEAGDRDFRIAEKRREIGAKVATVFLQRPNEAGDEIVKRDVVVAGHHQQWEGHLVEKRPSREEFRRMRPLRQIAGDDHEIGPG